MQVLVTGGAGYIGSHTVLSLLKQGHEVIVVDDLSNSSKRAVERVEKLANKKVKFYQCNLLNKSDLDYVFLRNPFEMVIHFAGFKAVGESVNNPVEYYQNNVAGTLTLIETMLKNRVYSLVFSSSATVYGTEMTPPYSEDNSLGRPSSPYGQTKLMIEQILRDVANANPLFKVANLRYFNPIGADNSGEIGEDPIGIPNNLMPFISQVAGGRRDKLSIFGNDYETNDGTCERDYIHVSDLAEGHVKALHWLKTQTSGVCESFNLGTGKPLSVMQIIKCFEESTEQKVPYEIVDRRNGDLPAFWANAEKAQKILNWQAQRSIEEMMEDTWRWQVANPLGYRRS